MADDKLNEMDRWILDYLDRNQWATPNLIRARYNEEERAEDNHVSRQWVFSRIKGLEDDGHVEEVHPEANEYQLVEDPRD